MIPGQTGKYIQWFGLILAGFGLCLFCHAFVAHEQPAYSWDYGSYARMLTKFVKLFSEPGHAFSENFAWSVANDDYNPTSVALLMPMIGLLGDTRSIFIMAIVGLYLVPAVLMTIWLAEAMLEGLPRSPGPRSIEATLILCAFLASPYWITAMRGWPDVVGLVPLGLATLVIVSTNYLAEATVKAAVFAGLMIWLSFLLRRTYAFAGLSLLGLAFVFCIASILRDGAPVRARLATAFAAFAICGGAALTGLLAFQAPLARHVLMTSYADEYSAYQNSFGTTISFVYGIFGPLFSAMVAIGVIRALRDRIVPVLFTTLASVLSFCLFIQIQMPGEQHVLPLYFWLFPAFALGVRTLFDGVSTWRRAAVWVVPALTLAGFLATFAPSASAALVRVGALLPSYRAFPLKIDHYAGYRSLLATLHGMVSPKTKIIVLASTEDLTSSYLESMDASLAPHLLAISDVDARDGLDFGPLAADIAVVSDPVSLGNPAFQRTVSVPDRMILKGRDYGDGFVKVAGPFLLGHGQRVLVYKRTRAMTKADESALTAAMQAFYPKWTRQPDGKLF